MLRRAHPHLSYTTINIILYYYCCCLRPMEKWRPNNVSKTLRGENEEHNTQEGSPDKFFITLTAIPANKDAQPRTERLQLARSDPHWAAVICNLFSRDGNNSWERRRLGGLEPLAYQEDDSSTTCCSDGSNFRGIGPHLATPALITLSSQSSFMWMFMTLRTWSSLLPSRPTSTHSSACGRLNRDKRDGCEKNINMMRKSDV